jgi:hypothetical protein
MKSKRTFAASLDLCEVRPVDSQDAEEFERRSIPFRPPAQELRVSGGSNRRWRAISAFASETEFPMLETSSDCLRSSFDNDQHERPRVAKKLIELAMAGLVLMSIYAASSGPVIARLCRNAHSSSTSRICDFYRPLFHFAPETTSRYVCLWGVTDIEVFFLLCPAQSGRVESR